MRDIFHFILFYRISFCSIKIKARTFGRLGFAFCINTHCCNRQVCKRRRTLLERLKTLLYLPRSFSVRVSSRRIPFLLRNNLRYIKI